MSDKINCRCDKFIKCINCIEKSTWGGLSQDQRIAAVSLAQAISKGGNIEMQVKRASELKVDACMIPDDIFIKC